MSPAGTEQAMRKWLTQIAKRQHEITTSRSLMRPNPYMTYMMKDPKNSST